MSHHPAFVPLFFIKNDIEPRFNSRPLISISPGRGADTQVVDRYAGLPLLHLTLVPQKKFPAHLCRDQIKLFSALFALSAVDISI